MRVSLRWVVTTLIVAWGCASGGNRLPGAPTQVLAVAGDSSVTIHWTAPADDGGNPILSYAVTTHPSGVTVLVSPTTSATVVGLTNGSTYTFTVHASTRAGDGPESAPSSPVVPQTGAKVPGAPTNVQATPGDARATVTWTAPADAGSSAITGYTVTAIPGGATARTIGATTATVSGLTNGTGYTFTVHATNGAGDSAESQPSPPVTPQAPARVPGAPTDVMATAADASATLTWMAPADAGSSALSGYVVTVHPTGVKVQVGVVTSTTVTGLTNGLRCTFTVAATNAAGTGPDSESSNPVTPQPPAGAPDAPTNVTASPGVRAAHVSWLAPVHDGGSPVTGYVVTPLQGAQAGTPSMTAGDVLAADVTGLANGTTYTFSVVAVNEVGSSPPAVSAAATTPDVPGTPTSVSASVRNAEVTVQWSPPAHDGGVPVASYTVTASPQGMTRTVFSPTTSATFDGLTNGQPATFVVRATNAVGDGPDSAPSNAVTPLGVPDAGHSTLVTDQARVPADGQAKATLTLTLRDMYGQPLGGEPVTFSTTGLAGANLSAAGATTDAGGILTATVSAGAPGVIQITVTSQFVTFTVSVRFVPAQYCAGHVGLPALPISSVGSTALNASLEHLVRADFNRDGRLDLAGSLYMDNAVSVLPGVGDGTFGTPVVMPVGQTPGPLAVGDFNSDGLLDLVVANTAETDVGLLLGKGDGTFQPQVKVHVDDNPSRLVLGDFDGDGKLDVVTGSIVTGGLSLLLGKGDGTFQPTVKVATVSGLHSVAAADFDGDQRTDLVVATYTYSVNTSELLLYRSDGQGSFLAPTPLDTAAGPEDVVAGVLVPGGPADLVVAHGSGAISVMPGNGNGTFLSPVMLGLPSTSWENAVELDDFNGDGVPDLLAGGGALAILLGNGDRTFQVTASDVFWLEPLTAGDFNGDGHLDVVVATTSPVGVATLFGDGQGRVNWVAGFSTASDRLSSIEGAAVGDFNGDGKPDLLELVASTSSASNGNSALSVVLGDGQGGFGTPITTALSASESVVAVADLDLDHNFDVVLAHATSGLPAGGRIDVLRGNGDGTFQPVVSLNGGTLGPLLLTDLNGDGTPDIAMANPGPIGASYNMSNTVTILFGMGNMTYRSATIVNTGIAPTGLVSGDFNHDGLVDLATFDYGVATYSNMVYDGTVSVLLGLGNGKFKTAVDYVVPVVNGGGTLTTADLNGDGALDLITSNALLLGNGDGTFRAAVSLPGATNGVIQVADFNLDGIPDLLSDSPTPTLRLGVGDGAFQPPLFYLYSVLNALVGDFNGDGRPDILGTMTVPEAVFLPNTCLP